jgi:hypothetical protein
MDARARSGERWAVAPQVQWDARMKHVVWLVAVVSAVAGCTEIEDEIGAESEALIGADWESQLAFYCPGIDRAAGVTTYRGLAGTYVRLGLPVAEEPYRLTFVTVVDDPDAIGTFAGLRGLVPYAGGFRAIPDNPAIGAALALDIGGDGRFDETYFVLGLRRSWSGATITGVCLTGREHPFLMTRSYF